MALLVLKIAGLLATAIYNVLLACEAVALDRKPRRWRAFGSFLTAAILIGVAAYLIHDYRPGQVSLIY